MRFSSGFFASLVFEAQNASNVLRLHQAHRPSVRCVMCAHSRAERSSGEVWHEGLC